MNALSVYIKNKMNLSIILPAYNEEANIEKTVISVSSLIKDLLIEDYEIIVVNDGSKDKTGEVVKKMIGKIPNLKLVEHFPNKGYGGALRAGFANSTKDWIFFMDSDGQFDFNEIKLLIDKKDKGFDIVVGYRAKRSDNFMRKLNAFGWGLIVRILFGYLARDIDCAFKLFKREILSKINIDTDGAMVTTEFLAGAKARGYKIAEIPVSHFPRKEGNSTGADLHVILKAFRDLFAFRVRLSKELKNRV